MIGASPGQMRLLHAIARQAGDTHGHIRDRAATLFDLTSLTELSGDQARELIDIYQKIVTPPEPPKIARFHFGNLPKRVEKKSAVQVPKPVEQALPAAATPPSAALRSSGGIGRFTTAPVPKPTLLLKPKSSRAAVPAFNPDPHFKIDPELAKIPW